MEKVTHFNNELSSNRLACGALKEPNKTAFRLEEMSNYSHRIDEVTCKRCIKWIWTKK